MRSVLCLSLLSFVASLGQSPDARTKLGDVRISGSFRSRAYAWDWFQASTGSNEYGYTGNLLRVNFAEQRKTWDWDAEFAAPFLLGLPDKAIAPAPRGALGLGANYFAANGNSQYTGMVFPKQLYARIKGLGPNEAGVLQVGRFEFNDGTEMIPKNTSLAAVKRDRISQRLIGTFGWSDVGRSFDGIHFSYDRPATDFTLIAAIPTRGVFQTDGWGWNRAAIEYAAFTHEWGHGIHNADTRIFVLDYDDWRRIVKIDNRPAALRAQETGNIRIETFGAHSLHALTTDAGAVDLFAWGVVQTGRWGVQSQQAFALDFEGGFQPKILPRLKAWLRGGFTIGSGDTDANDARHGTFFQVLPTPRPYARFPFFNMMNTEDRFGSLVLRPHSKATISSEFHSLRLTSVKDLWYSGGGVYQPWSFGYIGRSASGQRSLGNLYDTSVEFRASRNTTFTAYFGHVQGLAAIRQIYPNGKNGEFGYVEAMFKF